MDSVEKCIELAIRHVNAGQPGRALLLCEHAIASHPPNAAIQQLVALLALQSGHLERSAAYAARSLELRPDHPPTLILAGDVARARRDFHAAQGFHRRAQALVPDHADAALSLGLTIYFHI